MLFLKLFFSRGEVTEMACRCKAFGVFQLPVPVHQVLRSLIGTRKYRSMLTTDIIKFIGLFVALSVFVFSI
jgi:hypothetical protein